MKPDDPSKFDRIVANARRAAGERGQTYRERALKIYPWICRRCARVFTRANLRELTVHHRDHNHDNNPPNGSNLGTALSALPRQRTPTAIGGHSTGMRLEWPNSPSCNLRAVCRSERRLVRKDPSR
jgi:hypothetical protein